MRRSGNAARYLRKNSLVPSFLTLLTTERGWTAEKYVKWFVQLAERMFLSNISDAPS